MKRVTELFNRTQFGSLATSEEGMPAVRPMQFQFEEEGKFFFCTSSEKRMVMQLRENPVAEFTAWDIRLDFARIAGPVFFSEDEESKERIRRINPFFAESFPNGDDEEMIVFFIVPDRILLGNYNSQPGDIIQIK